MNYLLQLGNVYYIIPSATFVFVLLMVSDQLKTAVLFISSVFLCAAIIGGLKKYFEISGVLYDTRYYSPSGHASMAAIFFGWISYFIFKYTQNYLLTFFAFSIIILISIGLIITNNHTVSEVILGLFIAGICSLLMRII